MYLAIKVKARLLSVKSIPSTHSKSKAKKKNNKKLHQNWARHVTKLGVRTALESVATNKLEN